MILVNGLNNQKIEPLNLNQIRPHSSMTVIYIKNI